MLRFRSRRLATLFAMVSLALLLVFLGAASKHSQFESPSQSTYYLKQSVKMAEGAQDHAVLAALPQATVLPGEIVTPSLVPDPPRKLLSRVVGAPLLI